MPEIASPIVARPLLAFSKKIARTSEARHARPRSCEENKSVLELTLLSCGPVAFLLPSVLGSSVSGFCFACFWGFGVPLSSMFQPSPPARFILPPPQRKAGDWRLFPLPIIICKGHFFFFGRGGIKSKDTKFLENGKNNLYSLSLSRGGEAGFLIFLLVSEEQKAAKPECEVDHSATATCNQLVQDTINS